MNRRDFKIGMEFTYGNGTWRCTDIGSRTVVAIRIDQVLATIVAKDGTKRQEWISRTKAEKDGWFNGPPYAVAETVIDEYEIQICEPVGGPQGGDKDRREPHQWRVTPWVGR